MVHNFLLFICQVKCFLNQYNIAELPCQGFLNRTSRPGVANSKWSVEMNLLEVPCHPSPDSMLLTRPPPLPDLALPTLPTLFPSLLHVCP